MRSIKLFAISCGLLLSFFTEAQLIVYRSYDDYLKNFGENYDDLIDWKIKGTKAPITLIISVDSQTIKMPCKEMWGFRYKGSLFRIDTIACQPAMVMSDTKLIYYENGPYHLDLLMGRNMYMGIYQYIGYSCYISSALDSKMVFVPILAINGYKKLYAFRDANPQFNDFFTCLKEKEDKLKEKFGVNEVGECAGEFNATH